MKGKAYMNDMQVFTHPDFGEISAIEIDGKPYLPATECAKILGYSNPQKAIRDHCRKEGCTIRSGVSLTTNQHGKTTGQQVDKKYIDEGNLYRLIARSQLPAAEKFERWVFDVVLPAIRKHGAYMTPQRLYESLASPQGLMVLLHKLADEQQVNAGLLAQVSELRPKAEFADAVTASPDCVSLGEMAKILRQNGLPYGRTRMCEALRQDGFLIRQDCVDYNTPTQHAMERGLFYHCKHVKDTPGGFRSVTNVVRVTGKGQQILLRHFRGKHQASAGENAA